MPVDQLGHLEHGDRVLAVEHLLQLGVGPDGALVLGVWRLLVRCNCRSASSPRSAGWAPSRSTAARSSSGWLASHEARADSDRSPASRVGSGIASTPTTFRTPRTSAPGADANDSPCSRELVNGAARVTLPQRGGPLRGVRRRRAPLSSVNSTVHEPNRRTAPVGRVLHSRRREMLALDLGVFRGRSSRSDRPVGGESPRTPLENTWRSYAGKRLPSLVTTPTPSGGLGPVERGAGEGSGLPRRRLRGRRRPLSRRSRRGGAGICGRRKPATSQSRPGPCCSISTCWPGSRSPWS